MISVSIFGSGNLAMHLLKAFKGSSSVKIVQLYSRQKIERESFSDDIECITEINKLKDTDVYIIAITDDAIPEFSAKLLLPNKLVVHTSGSVALDQLQGKSRKGVFYPVQTFTKGECTAFKGIPICIEATENRDLKLLYTLAGYISDNVFILNSEQRKKLHLAAVFINNFTNHLYKIAFDILKENQIPLAIVYPLLLETARKAVSNDPGLIQTGPARRNNKKTIDMHLKQLESAPADIYKILTRSIEETYGKEL